MLNQGIQMISLICVNPNCKREFYWDEPTGWIIAEQSDRDAEKFVAYCTCKTGNIVWMKSNREIESSASGGYLNAV
jgi:hypothetical protein